MHRRAAVRACWLQRADDETERHGLDLDRDALGLVKSLAVDLPLGRARPGVQRDLVRAKLAWLVDGDERRLHQIAERAALGRHAGYRQSLVERADAGAAEHPVEDHPGREVAHDKTDPSIRDVIRI